MRVNLTAVREFCAIGANVAESREFRFFFVLLRASAPMLEGRQYFHSTRAHVPCATKFSRRISSDRRRSTAKGEGEPRDNIIFVLFRRDDSAHMVPENVQSPP